MFNDYFKSQGYVDDGVYCWDILDAQHDEPAPAVIETIDPKRDGNNPPATDTGLVATSPTSPMVAASDGGC